MFIISKQTPSESDEIIRVFYCNDITTIRNWVKNYIEQDITSYSYSPNEENTKYVTYELNDGENSFQLLKKYKRVYKGYVYNSSERTTEIIYSISILEYNDTKDQCDLNASNMLNNIQNEINNRVLKQLDKDALLQVLTTIENRVHSKPLWNRTEFTGVVTDTLKYFKKELYSSVAKRMRRYGKRNTLNKVPEEPSETH
jgi:preprotein translocase subunit SecD